jgi:hypothetical protein
MSIPSRQIGWSNESNLLWQISKQLEQLTGVTSKISSGDSGTANPFFIPDILSFQGISCANIAIDLNSYYPNEFYSSKIEAPNLITVNNTVTIGGAFNSILTEINFPKLTTVGSTIYITYWVLLQTIDISSLNQIGNGAPSYINISNNPQLQSVLISPSLSIYIGSTIIFTNNALNETSVDSILSALVEGDATDCTINLDGGTNAAPSVTGAGYVDTLVANGCTVTTN